LAFAALPKHGRTLRDLIPTLRHSPGFWVSQLSTGQSLFRGEAGTFIDHIPSDSNTHVTLFNGSLFNHADDWERRLADFPNITVERRDGVHLTGTDIGVIKQAIDRVVISAVVQA
jgi:hypothetical protein